MNKFLTFAGQQPVYLGDIDFMQSAGAAVFTALARAIMASGSDSLNAILQGVSLSYDSNTVSWTNGIVVLDGEILPVAAGSATGTQATPLYLHVSSVESGERTFKDGVSRACWETRTATITLEGSGGVLVSSLPRNHAAIVYDDAEYPGNSDPGIRLIRRSGLWFCDWTISGLQGGPQQYEDTVVFSDLTPEQASQLAQKNFYVPVVVEFDGSTEIVPLYVQFSDVQTNNAIQMTVSFSYTLTSASSGSTKLQTLIPVF